MRALGALLVAVLVGIAAIWLFIKLLGLALKLLAVVIGIGIAVGIYFLVARLVGGGR